MDSAAIIARYQAAYTRYTGEELPVKEQPDGTYWIQHKDGGFAATQIDLTNWTAYMEGKPAKAPPPKAEEPAAPAETMKSTAALASPGETRKAIAKMMVERPTWKSIEIGKKMGLSKTAVRFHLLALVRDGKVEMIGEKKNAVWGLVQKAKEPAPAPPVEEEDVTSARDAIIAQIL